MSQIDKEFIKILDEIIAKATQNGGLMTIGSNQSGKSNAVMWLVRRIRDSEVKEASIRIFDPCLNWPFNFDKVPYLDYSTWLGELPITRDLIITLSSPDPLDRKAYIADILSWDYEAKRQLKASTNGLIPYHSYYIIEEMQNVFGTSALGQVNGRSIYTTFCEGANFGMCFFGIGQRLADISTKIVERRRYFLFGRANGDNDLQKIARMFNKDVTDKIASLKVSPAEGITQFVFFDREDSEGHLISFPKFVQTAKPEPIVNPDLKSGHVQKLFFTRRL